MHNYIELDYLLSICMQLEYKYMYMEECAGGKSHNIVMTTALYIAP